MAPDHEIFELGAVTLQQSGNTLPDAKLAYKTYGSLNARGDNVIVMPTFFTGTHVRNEGYLRAVPALDSSRYFIVSINTSGNGLSSSPSNTTTEDANLRKARMLRSPLHCPPASAARKQLSCILTVTRTVKDFDISLFTY